MLLLLTVITVDGQTCSDYLSCDACISSNINTCVWCNNRQFVKEFYYPCGIYDNLIANGCPAQDIITVVPNINIISGTSQLLTPLKVQSSIHVRERKKINVTLTPIPNIDADIYILIDISASMLGYFPIVQQSAIELLKFVKSISAGSKVGFGTFIDKEIRPFSFHSNSTADHLKHEFYNTQPLTSDIFLLNDSILSLKTSSNYDFPEGTLDAALQVILCDKQIGWSSSSEAFRLLVVMTDDDYHFALDGMLAGITTPNSVSCRLQGRSYVASYEEDYPTVLQFIRAISNADITPLFVIEGDVIPLYTKLLEKVAPGLSTVPLTTNVTQLTNAIQNAYMGASTSTRPKVVTYSPSIRYNLELTSCSGITNGLNCYSISANSSATYQIEVWLDTDISVCNAYSTDTTHSLSLEFLGFGKTDIHLTPVCSCECSENLEFNSSDCNNKGHLSCSSCRCQRSYSGSSCDCPQMVTQSCIQPESGKICSNRGSCSCGICNCSNQHFGDYCECDNSQCPRHNGDICGGPDRGTCQCDGNCLCNLNYTSLVSAPCSCLNPETEEARLRCTNPSDTLATVCSGHGECVCGECVCENGMILENFDYVGEYCEICNICDGVCDKLRKCVSCQIRGEGDACCKDYLIGTPPPLIELNDTEFSKVKNNINYRVCNAFDQNGCIWDYALLRTLTGDEIDFKIFTRRGTCNPPLWWPWLVIFFFLIVIIGSAILLVLRLIYYFIKRREYHLFVKYVKHEKMFGQNPIYIDPIQNVPNPGYNVLDNTL